jgi:hypothetical protein
MIVSFVLLALVLLCLITMVRQRKKNPYLDDD